RNALDEAKLMSIITVIMSEAHAPISRDTTEQEPSMPSRNRHGNAHQRPDSSAPAPRQHNDEPNDGIRDPAGLIDCDDVHPVDPARPDLDPAEPLAGSPP